MFILDERGNPVDPPPPLDPLGDLGITYGDLALVVRDGIIPVPKLLESLGLEHEGLIERMVGDGTLDANLKPLDPINGEAWASCRLQAYDDAVFRVFAMHPSRDA